MAVGETKINMAKNLGNHRFTLWASFFSAHNPIYNQTHRQDLAAGRQKPERGAKTRRGGTFLKYSIGCM